MQRPGSERWHSSSLNAHKPVSLTKSEFTAFCFGFAGLVKNQGFAKYPQKRLKWTFWLALNSLKRMHSEGSRVRAALCNKPSPTLYERSERSINPQLTPKSSMDSKALYYSINLKNGNQVNTLLANIELHRRTINMYAEMAEEAQRRHDYKTVNDIKTNKLPLVLDALNKAKKSLLKTIALSAFEVIDKL